MTVHTGTSLPPSVPAQAVDVPKLITADPALELVERWRGELTVLRRRSPGSDAVTTLTDCVRELVEAINAGRDVSIQLTLTEAHALSHIPVSTLRWMCNNKPGAVGARKREGVWYIDRVRFESYLASGAHHGRLPHDETAAADGTVGAPMADGMEDVA